MALVMPVTSLLTIMTAELSGSSRGTMTGLLSGSGFLGHAIAASFGGFLVAQVGYGALSVVLAVVTAASGLFCLFLKHSQAEQRARTYFAADAK
jgi:predicted MFS family arabinose efflux permease